MPARTTPRPFIGINADYLPGTKTASAQARLPMGYSDIIYATGGMPVIIPTMGKDAEIDSLLERLDGIVLSGGLDLDPRRQGQPTHPAVVPMPAKREEFDAKLLARVIARKMPVLAIGLGMQQLNAAFGGTLYLHLPEDMPKAMPHYDPSGGAHRHIVVVQPKTRMDDIYGGGELRVNSAHHQAVKTLGAKLRVGAKAPDDVIEAIEAADPHWFCLGVQWHPEAETAAALDLQLFDCFVQSAMRVSRPLAMAA